MKIPESEKREVARLMATGVITGKEVALARRTIHGAENNERTKGCLLLEDLSYQWVDDFESYRRIMMVHQLRAGSVQFRYVGAKGDNEIPSALKVIEHIHRMDRTMENAQEPHKH